MPDPKVRHRALRLIRLASDAPSNVQVSPTSLSLSAKVSDVETDTVSIATLLSTNGENSICDAQKLDVRLFGGWGTIQTGKVTGLSRVAPGRYKAIPEGKLEGQPCSKGSAAIDYDSALFTFPRPTQGTTLEVDWNLTLNGISVFQASDGSAPLIIAGNPSLEFRQTVAIDPGAFPTADTYLQRFITSLLRWFHGVVAIIVLLVLLYLAPWFKRGVDAALTRTGRIIKRRFQQKPPQTTAENATEVERPAFGPSYGGWGSRASPVWARNASMRAGRYWMRLSRFLMIAASWSTSRAARLPRPFFMFAQAPSAALRSGA